MNSRRFQHREPPQKVTSCACGAKARLIKRRNFPFGRGSGGKTSMVYRCEECKTERPFNNRAEVKR